MEKVLKLFFMKVRSESETHHT